MTALDLFRASLRRWYVVALCLSLTAVGVTRAEPRTVYWTSQVATVQSPATKSTPKRLGEPDSDPIPTAEMLAGLINRHSDIIRSKNATATLYGEGLYDTSSARVANAGNQWVTSVNEPSIQVESDAADPAVVVERQQAELESISIALKQLQDRFEVKPSQRMSLSVSPTQPIVQEIRGSRIRANASIILVGLILTLWAVYVTERVMDRRSNRRSADPA